MIEFGQRVQFQKFYTCLKEQHYQEQVDGQQYEQQYEEAPQEYQDQVDYQEAQLVEADVVAKHEPKTEEPEPEQ